MNIRFLLVSALLAVSSVCSAQTETTPATQKPTPAKENGPDQEVDSATAKGDRLRQPGFLFLELDCHDLARAIEFFREVAGFEINRNDGNFVPSGASFC